jgi:tetratricopeptide (TPR) repeat protein
MHLHERDIFLSSAFRDFMDVRAKIRAIDKSRIWAVEAQRQDLDTRLGISPFTIVDELIQQIRRSNLFICVLRDRYGSSVFQHVESVSFLETEIYQAALFHNNVFFFFIEPFNPDDKLRGLLELVQTIRPDIIPARAQREDIILDKIKSLVEHSKAATQRPWTISVRKLVGQLAFRRGYPRPNIELFDKVFRPVSQKPDRDHIRILLDGLSAEKSIEKRLTRTWIALRELCAAPYDTPRFNEYLSLWDETLGVWASAAAWYGLHGHLYAGRLAAVNSMLSIRGRIEARESKRDLAQYIQGTKGARASEYYSMAKLFPDREQRAQYLKLAENDVEDALRSIDENPSGYLAIRGHILLMQGCAGKALEDFERVRRLSEESGNEKRIGEALADLGLVHMRLGNIRLASKLLQEGTAYLDNAGSYTFAIRARKRLALVRLLSGHPFLAVRELCTAHDAAEQHQVFDQITPLMEKIHHIACDLGIWREKRLR